MERAPVSACILALTVALFSVICVWATTDKSGPERSTVETPFVSQTDEGLPTVVLDRTKIKVGETATILVVLQPGKFFEIVDPEIFLSDALELISTPLSGRERESLMRYAVRAKRSGDYMILIRAAVQVKKDGLPVRKVFERRLGLTVSESNGGILGGNAGVIIGAVLGVVSSFLGLYFKDWMEERAKKAGAMRWLCNELVGRLEAARLDVRDRRLVEYSSWMGELYSKYFSVLRRWDKQVKVNVVLSQEVIQIEGLFRKYNQSLNDVTVDDKLIEDLDHRIALVIERLGQG